MSPGWLLDEVASAGRENLDVDHVARYDDIADSGGAAEVALLVDLGLDEYSRWWTWAQAPASSPSPSPRPALESSPSTSRR